VEKTTRKERLREFSAGGVVFKKIVGQREKTEKVLWLITRVGDSSRMFSPDTWRLPKGWLDDANNGSPGPLASGKVKAKEEDLVKAALKEVEEEGGVTAKIIAKINTIKFFFTFKGKKILKFVTFYLMEWTDDIQEGTTYETAEIAWLGFKEAREKLTYSSEKKVLDKAKEILAGLESKI